MCSTKKSYYLLLAILIINISILPSCINNKDKTSNGYTGPITDTAAKRLQDKCHFMPKDTIAVWAARYQNFKKTATPDSLNMAKLYIDSCSFNNNIVRAIITNDSCIGLRVINGMDEQNKVHIILVGIKPDYSTLYIKKPARCGGVSSKKENSDEEIGGGEMADYP